MRPFTLAAFFLILALELCSCGSVSQYSTGSIGSAIDRRLTDVAVTGEGLVERILPDDRSGIAHQRFILRIASGQTVLIDHNIDLAPRIPDLAVGDTVEFDGEYVWNERGGLVHWTHHDPEGRHPAGWLKHHGKTYQ